MKTLLLGMGNPILSDDAIGVRLAVDFKAAFSSNPAAPSAARHEPQQANLRRAPSPLNGERAGVRGEKAQRGSTLDVAFFGFPISDFAFPHGTTPVFASSAASRSNDSERGARPLPL